MPTDHRVWFDDQHHVSQSLPVEGTRQYGQDCSVGRGEPRSLNLALEDEDLMAKGQDLGVTLITGHHQQPEPSNR